MAQPLETGNGRNTDGRLPSDFAFTRSHPQSEVYSDTNIPDPFMPGEITPAKEIEWAWWTQITENAFQEEEPEDWGLPDPARDPSLLVNGLDPRLYPVTSEYQEEIEAAQVEDDGVHPEDSPVGWGMDTGLRDSDEIRIARMEADKIARGERATLRNRRLKEEARTRRALLSGVDNLLVPLDVLAPSPRRVLTKSSREKARLVSKLRRPTRMVSQDERRPIDYRELESGLIEDLVLGEPISKGQEPGVWSFGPEVVFDASTEESNLIDEAYGLPPAELPPSGDISLELLAERETPRPKFGNGLPTYGAETRWDQSQ
ncbi:MAG: hypothetical protein HYW63_04240 [Candidatus Levybacteria bacterium]|nr:hypothetical protein [Candidatus Levybacteria bacterium]